jgi:cytochrome c-type biogenesis protein CcsB
MENIEFYVFNLTYILYTLSTIFYLIYVFVKKENLARTGFGLVIFASLFHASDLTLRAYIGNSMHQLKWYVPWSNWFESFSLFSFIIGITFIVVQLIYRLQILGTFVMSLLWLMISFSMTYPLFGDWNDLNGFSETWAAISQSRAIPQLMPALQSVWMAIHVPMMFISYSAFAIAFAIGIIYLIQERHLKSKQLSELSQTLPALDPLDSMIYRLIGWGFPILTLGIILGARWAYDAWGRYWGWDAKETWAFITWLTYAIYLHMRLVMSWRGRKTVILSVAAFAVVLFTYIGVNYLSELHGFLSGKGA